MTETRIKTGAAPAIEIITHVAALAATSDLWLVDIWGVMHNGVRPFAGAVDACERFRAQGGTVLLLSNAPRPAASVVQQLDRIGVSRNAYDTIVSSGDAARASIAAAVGKGLDVGHIGPERDRPLFDGLGATFAPVEVASIAVCTGLHDDTTETPADYAGMLRALKQRDVPMICANPDLTVERGGNIVYCAGAIAQTYEQLGGRVIYAGKPHLPVYAMAFETAAKLRGGDVSKARTLAIGDGIRTDIAGAAAAGIRSVFVASGIHVSADHPFDSAALEALFPAGQPRPVAAMTGLVW